MWVSVDGTDGAGKTSVGRRLRKGTDFRVMLRDDNNLGRRSSSHRIDALRELVWLYGHSEPVWEYGNRYWLYSLGSWFWLYYQTSVHPAIQSADCVITDGWALKHWARFRLYDDSSIRQAADELFASLPWPDHTIVLPPPSPEGEKVIKPSETGAFHGIGDFSAYQDKTWRKIGELAQELNGTVTTITYSCADTVAVKAAISKLKAV